MTFLETFIFTAKFTRRVGDSRTIRFHVWGCASSEEGRSNVSLVMTIWEPSPRGKTDMTEIITLQQLSWQAVKHQTNI